MKPEEILAELKIAKERIEFLENELKKPEKFEFKYDAKQVFRILSIDIEEDKTGGFFKQYLDFGSYRTSEDNAEEALKLNKESNIIGAIAEQIDVNYSKNIDWNDNNPKYYIYYNCRMKTFNFDCNSYISRALGTVYMTKEVATIVCEILNNKEVEL